MNIELHKYQCSVRQLLIYRNEWGLKVFREWCSNHWDFFSRHQADFEIQWRKGNRGTHNTWL